MKKCFRITVWLKPLTRGKPKTEHHLEKAIGEAITNLTICIPSKRNRAVIYKTDGHLVCKVL